MTINSSYSRDELIFYANSCKYRVVIFPQKGIALFYRYYHKYQSGTTKEVEKLLLRRTGLSKTDMDALKNQIKNKGRVIINARG